VRRFTLIAALLILAFTAASRQQQQPAPPAPEQQSEPQEQNPQRPAPARPRTGVHVAGKATLPPKKAEDPLLNPKLDPDSPEAKAVQMMYGVHEFTQVAISPNGKQVAWVESLTEKNGAPSANSAIYVASVSDRKTAHQISAAAGAPRQGYILSRASRKKARRSTIQSRRPRHRKARLVSFDTNRDWECFDANAGKDSRRGACSGQPRREL
jgi:hypothetical protein